MMTQVSPPISRLKASRESGAGSVCGGGSGRKMATANQSSIHIHIGGADIFIFSILSDVLNLPHNLTA
jgi:hypothetical protein